MIIVENLSKNFKIGFKRNQGALARILNVFSEKKTKRVFNVLENVSFEVKKGEILGIIGNNGCGKSTLLRIIAGIYSFDSGSLITNGKIVPIIGLGTGMEPRLKMKDNIFIIGSLLGVSFKELKKNFNSIVEFAGLKDFIETQIYQFSDGMKQRLAFSIAIHSNPDVLLLDEVFAVGDKDFRKDSIKKIKELVKEGVSVILVSHDLDSIRKHCNRVIWINNGKIFRQGKPDYVLKEYIK
jgi:ABC-2 type transport system ATP-binding protein